MHNAYPCKQENTNRNTLIIWQRSENLYILYDIVNNVVEIEQMSHYHADNMSAH